MTESRQARIALDAVRTAPRDSQVAALVWYADREHPSCGVSRTGA